MAEACFQAPRAVRRGDGMRSTVVRLRDTRESDTCSNKFSPDIPVENRASLGTVFDYHWYLSAASPYRRTRVRSNVCSHHRMTSRTSYGRAHQLHRNRLTSPLEAIMSSILLDDTRTLDRPVRHLHLVPSPAEHRPAAHPPRPHRGAAGGSAHDGRPGRGARTRPPRPPARPATRWPPTRSRSSPATRSGSSPPRPTPTATSARRSTTSCGSTRSSAPPGCQMGSEVAVPIYE